MKRRLIVLGLVFMLGITLIACGSSTAPTEEKTEAVESISAKESVEEEQKEEEAKTDPVSQKVIDDISSIGDVTIEDKELIERITEIYATLTDSQKEQVTNYIDLVNAQEKISELEKEASQAEEESKEEEEADPDGENPESEQNSDNNDSLAQYIGVYKGLCLLEGQETNLFTLDVDIYMKDSSDARSGVGSVYCIGDAGEGTDELYFEEADANVGENHYDIVLRTEHDTNNIYYGFFGTEDNMMLDYYIFLDDGSQLLIARMEREK